MMTMMTSRKGYDIMVIVAGSRSFNHFDKLEIALDKALKDHLPWVTIISGTARGVDTMGERYALKRGLGLEKYPADWEKHGRSAGMIRNEEMANNADWLIAIWDGKSRGTEHMINTAMDKGLKVTIIRYETDRRRDA